MKIIVHRRYAHLLNDLAKAFELRSDVIIWMDRRFEERRSKKQQVVLFDRRRNQRRTAKEALAEVIAKE